jgi:hypothetical protein
MGLWKKNTLQTRLNHKGEKDSIFITVGGGGGSTSYFVGTPHANCLVGEQGDLNIEVMTINGK